MKERILIANRGEIAIRIIQACEELGLEHVVVYTPEDRYSMHVRMAGKAFQIASYKDPNEIFEVADHAKCTAIHPGYGFFSENFRFARRAVVRSRPIRFIGPRWEVIRDLGSKINTKKIAKALDIPVIPGTDRPIYNEIEAEGIAEWLFLLQKEQGIVHPSILVKASAGGGGMGIEEVNHLDTFRRVYRRIQSYSKRQFGDEGVLIEQCLRDYHHLEVQLVCSQHSEITHFGTRNCTIQSTGRQKRVEIAPGFDPDYCTYPFDAQKVLDRIVAYSVKLARHVQYDNVGTWEWVVTRDGNPYLLEVNTRIQVENGISARIARISGTEGYPNIVKEQIRVAFGDRLGYSQEDISFSGTSIELRIVAEDAKRGFKPWCGTITRFAPHQADWVSVHTHIPPDLSYFIPTEYDPNLALAIIWGQNTAEAVARARIFIENTQIEGKDSHDQPIITNLPYLQEKLNDVLKF
ncbi:MAG: biotin carboxylase N-terminal domain-containing protein [Dissulfuribacterales bacterium]